MLRVENDVLSVLETAASEERRQVRRHVGVRVAINLPEIGQTRVFSALPRGLS